ncbi:hypothetical protein RI054_14g70430 [Pseudoscourfieldia marina]
MSASPMAMSAPQRRHRRDLRTTHSVSSTSATGAATGGGPNEDSADSDSAAAAAAAAAADNESSQPPEMSNITKFMYSLVVMSLASMAFVLFQNRQLITHNILHLLKQIEGMGMWGPLVYVCLYTILELLCVPCIPLTMTAGAIFGVPLAVALVAIGSTIAGVLAYTISKNLFRDSFSKLLSRFPSWEAIDRAIGRDGFKVLFLLRLSPLIPQATANYLYGLSSIKLVPYATATFLGFLLPSFAYVALGRASRTILDGMNTSGNLKEAAATMGSIEAWTMPLGLAITFVATALVVHVSQQALDKAMLESRESYDEDDKSSNEGRSDPIGGT